MASVSLSVIACTSAQEAIQRADIITTCTADKKCATILTNEMVGTGIHANVISGDCPGKTELDKEILERADVFVEFTHKLELKGIFNS